MKNCTKYYLSGYRSQERLFVSELSLILREVRFNG